MNRLTKEEQADLVEASRSGDVDAFRKLIEELAPFVKYVENSILTGYEANGIDLSDVSREDINISGVVGLIKSVYRYDSSFDVKFSTYAYSFIAEEIRRQLDFELNRTGITGSRDITGISIDEDNGLAESIEAMDNSILENLIEECENDEAGERIAEAFATLSENEKKALFMIHGIDCEKTTNYKRIARELGVSDIMVKAIVNDATKKISKALGE